MNRDTLKKLICEHKETIININNTLHVAPNINVSELKKLLIKTTKNLDFLTRTDYIMMSDKTLTLREVGLYLNVSRERVRQIEEEALENLETTVFKRILKDHIYITNSTCPTL